MPFPKVVRGLYLCKKILQAHPNGFCGAIITGPRGIGKTSFVLNVGWEVYRELGYNEEESWIKTLDHVKFKINDVIDFIEINTMSETKEHLLIWDDAGVYAGTMEWWTNRDALKRLKSVTDTIRTGVCSLLITTPSESGLTKFLRDYDDYIVQIGYHEDGGEYRKAKGYLKRTLPSGTIRVYSKFKNRFYVMLPDWVFEKYMARRDAVLTEQIAELKKIIDDQEAAEKMKELRQKVKLKTLQKQMEKLSKKV